MNRDTAWEAAGNAHLLKHIRVRMSRNATRWGDPGLIWQGKYSRAPSAEFRAQVQRLIKAKDLWVADMRDLDKGDGVPTDIQKKIWSDYITQAEKLQEKRAA